MANDSRQERQLMRQRGAGSRQINSIDFGFAFTTPSQLRRSRTRSQTPQTTTRSVRQATKTPKDFGRSFVYEAPPSTRSTRSSRSASEKVSDNGNITFGQPPLKRRRLSEISNLSNVTYRDQTLDARRTEPVDEAEEDVLDRTSRPDGSESISYIETVLQSIPDINQEDKENNFATLSSDKLKHRRRKRKSIGQQKKKKRYSIQDTVQDLVRQGNLSQVPENEDGAEHNSWRSGIMDIVDTSFVNAEKGLEEPGSNDLGSVLTSQSKGKLTNSGETLPSKRHRKSKSSLFTRKKRKSTDTNESITLSMDRDVQVHYQNQPASFRRKGQDACSNSGFDDEDKQPEHESFNNTTVSRRPRTNETQHKQIEIHSDDSEDSDQEYQPEEASPKPTPAPNRRNKAGKLQQKKPLHGRLKNKYVGKKPKNHSKSTVPILTHRITNSHYLPIIDEAPEAEETAQDETCSILPSFTTRDTPNAIDVLAQMCRETIDSAIGGLQKQPQMGKLSKSQLKLKVMPLENFRSELETRLFNVSQSLDQRLQLEARLQKTRREKTLVQNQWLDLRKQRDKIALRIDAVRREHWEIEVVGRRAWEASEAARALEVEVQRSEDVEGDEENINGGRTEIMLRSLVGDVSSVDGQGVLQKLKAFNAQLEATTGLCETA